MRNTKQAPAHPSEPEMPTSSKNRSIRNVLIAMLCALGAGLVASLLAVVTMGLLRLLAGIPTPVELFGDRILKSINVDTFIRLLLTFAPNSKTTPLLLALLGMIGLGTLLGLLYALLVRLKLPVQGYRPARREWLVAASFAVGMTLLGSVLFWNELPQNLYGPPLFWATILSILGLLLDFGVFGLSLSFLYRVLLPKEPTAAGAVEQGRRQMLSRAGVAVLGLGAGAGTLGVVKGYLDRYSSYDGLQTPSKQGITVPITPNDEHYVVTQNAIDPSQNIDLWRLEVGGLVEQSGNYTYNEVQQLPSTSRAITLECIANGVGSHLMSTAIWQGVTLSTLLARHHVVSSATHIAFYSVDGYNMSLPLAEVLEVDPLLAWKMNGEVLPQRHGYPMRVLIPGRFGEENPKWLTRIELTDHFVQGLYSSQGWYNGPLHTTSRIDRPLGRVAAAESIEVAGIAFAGNRSIQKVEVSVDGGTNWQQATLKPPLSQDAWVHWTWNWVGARPGDYTLQVRATDGTGDVQTSKRQGTVPNGATGYHIVPVQVR